MLNKNYLYLLFILFNLYNCQVAFGQCINDKPIIQSFEFQNGILTCYGTGFSNISSMKLLADGIAYNVPPTSNNSFSVVTPIPYHYDKFLFQLIVGNKISDVYTYVDGLSTTFLNLTGGTTCISGIDFIPTSDNTTLKLFINGVESTIYYVLPGSIGSIHFDYPAVGSYGYYSFELQFNNITILNSQIGYFKYIPQLFSDQLYVARRVLEYRGIITNDPCSFTYIFTCLQHNSMFLYIETATIYANTNGPFINITEDITTFWNASQINIMGNLLVLDYFWTHMFRFVKLNTLLLGYQLFDLPSSAILPPTLETLVINTYNGTVNNVFFNSSLKELSIYSGLNNFSVIPCPVNNKLQTLSIPVTPTIGLPNNGFNLLSLNKLTIYVNNYQFTLPNNFNVQFPNIQNLGFSFGPWSGPNLFDFPSSIELLQNLKSFSIYGNGFKNPIKGYMDFLNSPSGISISLNQVTQNYIAKVNPNSDYYLSNSNVLLNNIDFSNYTGITVWYNNIPQTLPLNSINFNSINYLTFAYSKFYGDVNPLFCRVPKNNLYLIDNNLNGTVPTCFMCTNTNERSLFFPNPYSNFNINSQQSCPTFNIQSNIVIVGSNQNTNYIKVQGTDLGYTVSPLLSTSPDISISIPNTEILITIPPNFDISIPYQYSFHDGLILFSFTFSYQI